MKIIIIIIVLAFAGCKLGTQKNEMYANIASNDTKEEQNHEHDEHEHEHEHYEHENELDEHEHEQEDEKHNETDYETITVKKTDFYEIIRTSGEILSAQGDEIIVSARHDGIVLFDKQSLMEGNAIKAGSGLLTISNGDLLHDNLKTGFVEAKNNFDKARKNYERAVNLHRDTIISEKEFVDISTEYENARNAFEVVKKNYVEGGQIVVAPQNGFIKKIHVAEGEFVETGTVLMTLIKNKRLVIKAEVSQRYFDRLNSVKSANFVTPYNNATYDIERLNGQLISYGKTTGNNSLYMPVFFEIDNTGDIIGGTFIEVFLKCKTINNAIVLPKSALMEEFGHHYVFVKHDNEFDKHYVQTSGTDGMNVLITGGIEENDVVATKNVYRLKLAGMSAALPAHNHAH